MNTPEYLLHCSEPAENIAEMLHSDIINRIIERMMIRIGRGEDYLLTATDKWQLEVLQDAGYLLKDIQKEIAKRTKQQEYEIREAMIDAGVRAIDYDNVIYEAAGLSPLPLMQSPYLMRLMERNYQATLGEWRNYTRTTANAAQQLFIQTVDKAYHMTASGAISYTQAVREAVNEVVKDGVYVKYPSGHRDTIETATLRAVRTGISQACGQITDARMQEMDWDIVLVSAHLGARVTDKEDYTNHFWWQGKFYSRTGRDKRFPSLSVCGIGDVQGLEGANCRHSRGPGDGEHNPFEQFDSEENRKAYEIQQRQRELERRIRNTKREVMGLKTSVDNCQDVKAKFELDMDYQRKSALLQKQNKAYNEFCKENNLKSLSDRISIAKWDRQQAAAARGAAKRYESAKDIAKPSSSDIIKSGARITNPESAEGRKFAETFYPEIRKRTTDSAKIAANLGKTQEEIKSVKDYLFMNKSLYDADLKIWRRFDEDCAIAQSWQRLTDGKNIKPHDITLVEHELYEMKIKTDNPNITHDEAHALAQEKYNYRKEADEYYGNLDKSKKKR